jgi:hypothetical protein
VLIPVLYYGVGCLNIFIPSSLGWIDVTFDMTSQVGQNVYDTAMGLTIALELLSCIFLADALRRIKNHLGD